MKLSSKATSFFFLAHETTWFYISKAIKYGCCILSVIYQRIKIAVIKNYISGKKIIKNANAPDKKKHISVKARQIIKKVNLSQREGFEPWNE